MTCTNSSFYNSQSYLGQTLLRVMKDGWLSDHYQCLRFAREFGTWVKQNAKVGSGGFCTCKNCAHLMMVLKEEKARNASCSGCGCGRFGFVHAHDEEEEVMDE